MRGAVKHRVERRFSVLAYRPRFLVPTYEKDGVVGRRGDRKRDEQVGRERRETDQLVVTQECHHTASRRQRQEHHHQHQQDSAYRSVDEQQHRDDHPEGDHLDDPDAAVARDLLVGDQRRSARYEHLDARRGRKPVNDGLDLQHRLVGQRLAHVACKEHLHVRRLAVAALRAGFRQRVAPEVLNVLDVLRVGFQPVDEFVVVPVRIRTERLIAFEDDHRRAVGLELFENLAHALHRDHRRRFRRTHRHRPHLADDFELRHGGVQDGDQQNPADDDGDRQPADPLGQAATPFLLRWGGGFDRRSAHRVVIRRDARAPELLHPASTQLGTSRSSSLRC